MSKFRMSLVYLVSIIGVTFLTPAPLFAADTAEQSSPAVQPKKPATHKPASKEGEGSSQNSEESTTVAPPYDEGQLPTKGIFHPCTLTNDCPKPKVTGKKQKKKAATQ